MEQRSNDDDDMYEHVLISSSSSSANTSPSSPSSRTEIVESLRFRLRGVPMRPPDVGPTSLISGWGAWCQVDGRPVLAMGSGSHLSLWDSHDNTWRESISSEGELVWGAWAPAFTPDAALLAAGGPTHVQVWRVGAHAISNIHREAAPLTIGSSRGWGGWSPSGELAASVTPPEISIWSETAGRRGKYLLRHPEFTYQWAAWFDKDGLLALGSHDQRVCLLRVPVFLFEDSMTIGVLSNQTQMEFTEPIAWGSWGTVDGTPVLAVGGDAGGVWTCRPDPSSDQGWNVAQLRGHEDSAVRWGAWADGDDAPVFATGDADGAIRFWDGHSGQQWNARTGGDPAPTVWGSWARVDGVPMLAAGCVDGSIRMWRRSANAVPTFIEDIALPQPSSPSLWGCWAEIDGRPVLATGRPDFTVQMWDLVVERSVARRPTYRSDDSAGVDRLNRSAEATALAELLLSTSAHPPLAVGLFGEWGEGKSYFLGLLQDQVRALAEGPEAFAHHHVRQVKFNAWHYAETDLWASLVAEIFGQLAQPANQGNVAVEQRERSRLVAEVVSTRQLHERLAAERHRAAQLEKSLKPPDWGSLSLDRKAVVMAEFGRNVDPQLVTEAYRAVTAPKAWGQLAAMRAVRVWRALPPRCKWATLMSATVALVALLVIGTRPEIPAKAIAAIVGFTPWVVTIAAFAKAAKNNVAEALDAAKSAREQVMKVVDGWEHQVQTALDVSKSNIQALEKEIQNLTAAGQLAGFVSERAAEGTYRKSLGLMTQIREDLQTMATLLMRDRTPGARDPRGTARLANLPARDGGGDAMPQIDRIVLYIDDLDRCPPRRVVELLEAVHLLLAVPLFVVVVAVDPRWLLRAIALHYREVLGPTDTASAADGRQRTPDSDPNDDDYWSSTPAQYLEKIFQVVFTLPSMGTAGFTSLLDSVIGPRADLGMDGNGFDVFGETPNTSAANVDELTTVTARHAGSYSHRRTEDSHPEQSTGPIELAPPPVVDRPDPLALNAAELTLIRLLGPPLINTPRAVKRLANSYGLLAAIGRLKDPDAEIDRLPAMVLLAALVGYPNLGGRLLTRLHRAAEAQPNSPWSNFLADLQEWSSENVQSAMEKESWRSMIGAIQKIVTLASEADILLPETVSGWHGWIALVGRLSFPAGSVAARLERFTP
jgi:WD40 repeat protein